MQDSPQTEFVIANLQREKQIADDAYLRWLEDGISAYAWMKDGISYVGTCGTTLAEALVNCNKGELWNDRRIQNKK